MCVSATPLGRSQYSLATYHLRAQASDDLQALERSRDHKWPEHCAIVRSKLQAPADWRPWTSQHQMLGVPTHLPRVLEVLDLGWIRTLRGAQKQARRKKDLVQCDHDTLRKGLWCDMSQAAQRNPIGGIPTLHQNAWLYSFEMDVVVPGEAHPLFHGYPTNLCWDAFGDSRQTAARHLIGESYSLPCAAAVFLAAFMTEGAPWWATT